MGYGIQSALEQIRMQKEDGLRSIYARTYGLVYLRARTFFDNEEEVKKLIQKVYQQLYISTDGITENDLYEWLGKKVYLLGRQAFRKKQAREMPHMEMEKGEMHTKTVGSEKVYKMMGEALEQLPDLYYATVFAFYYDYMSVETIAEIMDCTEGVILNRLNYARKFLQKALENYYEEEGKGEKEKVPFSLALLCGALEQWVADHPVNAADLMQGYQMLCKELELQPQMICPFEPESEVVPAVMVAHSKEDLEPLWTEIEKYAPKQPADKKLILGIGVGVLALIIVIVCVLAFGGNPSKKQPQNQSKQEETKDDPTTQPEAPTKPVITEPEVTEPEVTEPNAGASEYLIPDSNTRELTRADLEGFTKEQLRLARNEIYARHGMIFGDEELDQYFASKSWYTPKVSIGDFYDQVNMSLIEEGNINIIRSVEQERE